MSVREDIVATMVSASDSWLKEFDEAMKLADDIRAKIEERSAMVRAGENPSRLAAATRRRIAALGTKTDQLEDMLRLPASKPVLSDKEVRRRDDCILGLRYKTKQMAAALSANQPSSRSALIGKDARPTPAVETEQTAGLDTHGVVDLQRQMMREQDGELAELETTARSTKHIAIAIGGELDLHARLLDDLDADVEATTSRLKNAQKKVSTVSKGAGKTCNLIYIMLLIGGIALVLVVLVKLTNIF